MATSGDVMARQEALLAAQEARLASHEARLVAQQEQIELLEDTVQACMLTLQVRSCQHGCCQLACPVGCRCSYLPDCQHDMHACNHNLRVMTAPPSSWFRPCPHTLGCEETASFSLPRLPPSSSPAGPTIHMQAYQAHWCAHSRILITGLQGRHGRGAPVCRGGWG